MIFSWEFYINKHFDLQNLKNEEEAKRHFYNHGILEKRIYVDIPILFDWREYTIMNSDLQNITNEDEAWKHYLYYGKKENRMILHKDLLIKYCV